MYKRAFKELRGQLPSLEHYVYENWTTDRILPWHHLQGALPLGTLIKHLNSDIDISTLGREYSLTPFPVKD